ncbi:SDR family NAD(P)-dependent oxidoreductase, partial [Xanthomonas sp. SHU 166]
MDLNGRSVILTGASGGIGAALCDELVAAGACVLAVGRDPVRLAQVAGRHP